LPARGNLERIKTAPDVAKSGERAAAMVARWIRRGLDDPEENTLDEL
jgi:hypothetical protein